MGLETYRKKRHFERTPEPSGQEKRGAGQDALRFVVQKHAASHLHYDFRLEAEGVLKSWAVPKGPSLNPKDKRLAMMVEDHPFSYRDFEGTIPEGNYGAGSVIVWDQGTYEAAGTESRKESEAAVLRGLEDGHVSIVMHGEKLRGEYSLIKLRGRNPKSWLLIKKQDEFASDEDVTAQDRSVISDRTIEEVGGNEKPKKQAAKAMRRQGKEKEKRRRGEKEKAEDSESDQEQARINPPVRSAGRKKFVAPMLATLVDEPFDKEGWLFEVKWDGYRAIADVDHGQVKLYSRNEQSFAERYPAIVKELSTLKVQAILDGEIVAVDEQGVANFQLMQNYMREGKGGLVYYVFDLLELNGKDLRGETLVERKKQLEKVIAGLKRVRISQHIESTGKAFFEIAQQRGLEGIMAKKADSKYREGRRGHEWLKIKTHKRQEAVICGYTDPQGSRQRFGSLALGVYQGDELTFIGLAGGGFNSASLEEVYQKLKPLEQKSSPFAHPPKTKVPVHWVKPKLVCEVKFQEWTREGIMRQPVFLGLRTDKPARAIGREMPEHSPANGRGRHGSSRQEARSAAKALAANLREVPSSNGKKEKRKPSTSSAPERNRDKSTEAAQLTHVEKVYWPKEGYTKGDLLDYYRQVSDVILPYLADRPMNLLRHPNGIQGMSFFQKDVGRNQPPAFVETVMIAAESGQKKEYLVCQNLDTLLYTVNLGCIELNPWNARIDSLERPDYLVFDLDPVETDFANVIKVAQTIRKILEKIGIESYCKTSGKRGLHIFIPIGAKFDHQSAREIAELLARQVERTMPDIVSLARSPKDRRGCVYIDFLQNKKGTSMAAAYSVRPAPGATVSTPLSWSEVKASLDPAQFTMINMQRRLDKVGDLWKPVLGRGINFDKVMTVLGKSR